VLTTAEQLEKFGISAIDVGEQVSITIDEPGIVMISPAQARKFAFYLASAYHRANLEMDRRIGETDNLRDRVLLALRPEPLTKPQLSDVLDVEGYKIGHAIRTAELEELVIRVSWTPNARPRYGLTGAGLQLVTMRQAAA
jgi:hypothetical protein